MSAVSRARKFASGLGASLAVTGVAYLTLDSVNDIITLRKCQHQVVQLAADHEALCQELGAPIDVGPLMMSSIRFSPSGRMAKCQFSVEGLNKGSDVTATLSRPAYPSSIMYNLAGPGEWELLNCHVLVGGTDTLVTSVNLLTAEVQGPRTAPKPLPAHLFKEMQRFHAKPGDATQPPLSAQPEAPAQGAPAGAAPASATAPAAGGSGSDEAPSAAAPVQAQGE